MNMLRQAGGSTAMDALRAFLDDVKKHKLAEGRFLGLLHILIGRRVVKGEEVVSTGMTWRQLAALLKKVRWPKEAVRDLGLDPADLAPRDREKYWYMAIVRAGVDSPEAEKQANELASILKVHGYEVGPPPRPN